MIKRASNYDKVFLSLDQFLQMGIHLNDQNKIQSTIDKLKKMAIGTKLKYDGTNFLLNNRPASVYKLPDSIKNVREACQYMHIYHQPSYENTLAVLGANKEIVVLNSSHAVSDGCALLEMFNTLRDNKDFDEPMTLLNQSEIFQEEMKTVPVAPDANTNPGITRFETKDKDNLMSYGYYLRTYEKSKAEDLKCYDKKLKRPKQLTDALYAQLIVAASAFTGKFTTAGLKTIMNIRPLMKTKATFENGCVLSYLQLATKANENTTIKELMKMTRDAFNQQINDKVTFGFIKRIENPPKSSGNKIPGINFLTSNVGQFKLGGAIDDVFVQCSSKGLGRSNQVTFLHYAIQDDKGRNDCISQIQYTLNQISQREADLLTKSVHYGLENIDLDSKIGNAIEQMKEFQDNYIKTEYPKYLYSKN